MNYLDTEKEIMAHFINSGQFYHLNSPENFGIIFRDSEEFKAGMFLFALASKSTSGIKILAFELMNNHFHATIVGSQECAITFFTTFKNLLQNMCNGADNILSWTTFEHHLHRITTVDNLRNVIAYTHRNGPLVNPNFTPFNYPWGTNALYFNEEVKQYHKDVSTQVGIRKIRLFAHSHTFDKVGGIMEHNGIASPSCFCDVGLGESFFRDSRLYFFKISRDVESYKDIAEMIGESVYYADEEMFSIACKLSAERFGNTRFTLLPPESKMELARVLHNGYNAGFKQIQRMLRLDESVIRQMFRQ